MSIPANLNIRLAEGRDLAAILDLNHQLNPDDLPLPPDAHIAAVWSQLLDSIASVEP